MNPASVRVSILITLAPAVLTASVLIAWASPQESLKTLARERGGTYSLFSNTDLPAVSLQDVIDRADLIMQAVVLTRQAELSPDELFVRTVYALQPLRVFKDRRQLSVAKLPGPRPPITFFEGGGVVHVDGLTISFRSDMAAEPALRLAEEVIVFLTDQGPEQPLALSCGPYGLRRVAGGEVFIANPRTAKLRAFKNDRLLDFQEEVQRLIAAGSPKH